MKCSHLTNRRKKNLSSGFDFHQLEILSLPQGKNIQEKRIIFSKFICIFCLYIIWMTKTTNYMTFLTNSTKDIRIFI
jgi:hypothetical protein